MYNLIQIVDVFFRALVWLIIARIILSWIPFDPRHPVVRFVGSVTEPMLAPLRRVIPPIGGPGMSLDLSPFVAVLILEFLGGLVHNYLIQTLY